MSGTRFIQPRLARCSVCWTGQRGRSRREELVRSGVRCNDEARDELISKENRLWIITIIEKQKKILRQ